ncbi:MAG: ABC transporter permease [Alphaproteobacteria bacterium]|nr:ABC transporter permease [Alphaproteobacteria bacterium]
MSNFKIWMASNWRLFLAIGIFCLIYGTYSFLHPAGGSSRLFVQNSNESFVLISVAMAQTLPVLTGGLDLSVGSVMTMINALASNVVNGSPTEVFLGIILCLCSAALAGFINGCIIVYGRLQPIIVTLATGAVFMGIALFLRPTPGGEVDGDLSFAATFDLNEIFFTYGWPLPEWFENSLGLIPTPVVLIVIVVLVIWVPFKNSVTGRGCYAVGSAEGAAYMSGLNVDRSRLAAYTLAGLFAGIGGLYLALQTGSGNADIPQAGAYTLNSIAAVVIGGTSLYGGIGGVVGSIFGAMSLRAISFNFRVFDADGPLGFISDPLLQPLFEGSILLIAVSAGAARVFSIKNRLNLFGS